jgi:hypothetical protein
VYSSGSFSLQIEISSVFSCAYYPKLVTDDKFLLFYSTMLIAPSTPYIFLVTIKVKKIKTKKTPGCYKSFWSWAPVILATQEAEIRRMSV